MKLPVSMLREFVQTTLNPDQIGDLLTMAGFELEGIETDGSEAILDIKVCSNRGDGLSVLGLAREILAKDGESSATELYQKASSRLGVRSTEDASLVEISTPDCTRYVAVLFKDVANGDSPAWIQQRLTHAGMRPISLIVDLTNYVMLELGQPMHAFDYSKLSGRRIVVRSAKVGEKIATLDGIEHTLKAEQMMICDAELPVAVAGVMGGTASEVSSETNEVLLEVAHFVNTSVRRTRKQLGLSTDASYRFERSVDPEGVLAAAKRFEELLVACGGPSSYRLVDCYPDPPSPRLVNLRLSRANRLLGMTVSASEAERYLGSLGFVVVGNGEFYEVRVPTWRPDVVREDDLVEEIGRVHGYDRIPECLPAGSTPQGGVFEFEWLVDQLREAVVRCGFVQCISHSLRDLHPLDAAGARVGPRNPSSPETAYLRNSMLPSLADAAHRNGNRDLHLFEIGAAFVPEERKMLGALSTGSLSAPFWKADDKSVADFFSLKGSLQEIFVQVGSGSHLAFRVPNVVDSRYHPTQQAEIWVDETPVGIIGTLHPDVANDLGLVATAACLELDLMRLSLVLTDRKDGYFSISRNPAVRRDVAVLVSKSLPYEVLEARIRERAGGVLERQWLFDVYAGAGIPAGSHSLAIAMQFRKLGENFTDEEANQVRDRVVAGLVELGATLR